MNDDELLAWLRSIAGDCEMVCSVCTGSGLLARAGVLDGRRATTHWSRSDDIQHFDNVLWDLDRITLSDGRIFTSAGVTTGIDLALAIIRHDCGAASALDVARELVVQLRRTGGKANMPFTSRGNLPATTT